MKNKKNSAYLSIDLVFSLVILGICIYIFSTFFVNLNLWKKKSKECLDMQYRLNNQIREDIRIIENRKNFTKDCINEFEKDGVYSFYKKINLLDSKYGLIELDETISNGKVEKNMKAYAIIAGDLSL